MVVRRKGKVQVDFDVSEIMDDIIKDIVEPSADTASKVAQQNSKTLAPKDSGKLAASIKSDVLRGDEEVTISTNSNLDYAALQELGSNKSPGKHFLRGGTLRSVKALEADLKKNLRKTYGK